MQPMLGNTWRKAPHSAGQGSILLEEVWAPRRGAGGRSPVRADATEEAELDWAVESSCGAARMTRPPIHWSAAAVWPDCTRQSQLPDWPTLKTPLTLPTPLKLPAGPNTEKRSEQPHRVPILNADYSNPPLTIPSIPFQPLELLAPRTSSWASGTEVLVR